MEKYTFSQMIYNLADKFILSTFKRVDYHRQIGELYLDYEKSKMQELEKIIPSSSKDFYKESLKEPSIKAYLEVQGQTAIIDLDIAGYDVKKELDKSLAASFSNGLTFYLVKLVDNLIDQKESDVGYISELLNGFLHLYKTKGNDEYLKGLFNKKDILFTGEIISNLLNTEYLHNLPSHYETLEFLVNSEIQNHGAKSNLEKYNAVSDIGKYSAKLVVDLLSDYFPEFREKMEKHYFSKGRAANIFDDIKDFKLDRDNGDGYTHQALPLLCAGFGKEFAKSFIYLKPKSQWRYFNFLLLGALFQAQEAVGLKTRS